MSRNWIATVSEILRITRSGVVGPALNPQPLPPHVPVENLNPQPLPPHVPVEDLNPQPLPPHEGPSE
jgi:hypothetical protein